MLAISKGPPQIYRDVDVVEEVLTVLGYRLEWITIVLIKIFQKCHLFEDPMLLSAFDFTTLHWQRYFEILEGHLFINAFPLLPSA